MKLGLGMGLGSARGAEVESLTPPTVAPVLSIGESLPLSNEIYLSWTPSDKLESPEFTYVLEANTGSGWRFLYETVVSDYYGPILFDGYSDYQIRVIPGNRAGQGPASNAVSVTEPPAMGVPVVSIQSVDYTAFLTWAPISGAEFYGVRWQYYYVGEWIEADTGETSYTFNATDEGLYVFQVRAGNPYGWGEWSAEVGATL